MVSRGPACAAGREITRSNPGYESLDCIDCGGLSSTRVLAFERIPIGDRFRIAAIYEQALESCCWARNSDLPPAIGHIHLRCCANIFPYHPMRFQVLSAVP